MNDEIEEPTMADLAARLNELKTRLELYERARLRLQDECSDDLYTRGPNRFVLGGFGLDDTSPKGQPLHLTTRQTAEEHFGAAYVHDDQKLQGAMHQLINTNNVVQLHGNFQEIAHNIRDSALPLTNYLRGFANVIGHDRHAF